MSSESYSKWLAFGSGVGIEIGHTDLKVVLVRVRPSGATVRATLTIEHYAERPAGEWGSRYAEFLAGHNAAHLAAAVLIPRREVIVRHLALPGVGKKDLAQAVRFQIDGLHPYAEDEAVYDYARIGNSANVLVAITRRDVIERYISLFAEAGVKVSAITLSAAVMYGATRLFGKGPALGFLAVDSHSGEMEVYGESEARAVFSASFDVPVEALAGRARSLALSELRLEPDSEWKRFDEILPPPAASPEGFEITAEAMPYAASLAGACPHLFPSTNLLPLELRVTNSRARYIPSIVLGIMLLLGWGGLALYGYWEDGKYRDALQAEIKRLDPAARRPMAIDRQIAVLRQRSQLLDAFRRRTPADLDVLNELTHLLPPPGWLSTLEINRDQVRLTGETDQAAGLLRALDKSPLFEGSDFAMPLGRTSTGETFSIRSRREGVLP
jgi:hypothetical protein